jgi:excisionase family DNA binding protein
LSNRTSIYTARIIPLSRRQAVQRKESVFPTCLRYPTGYNRGMAKRIDPDEYVRIGTAAALAGVTRAYINRLISQGRFPAVRIDGQNFVRRADAEKHGKN